MAGLLDTYNKVLFVTVFLGIVLVCTEGSLQEQYIGCYHDTSSQSTWTNEIMNSDALTIELCIEKCAQRNKTFAILQTGRHCLCGDVLNVSSPINSCDTRCSGNGSEVCGGSSGAASAYVVYSVCPAGFYGTECNQTCHCKQQIPCNVLSGICPNGCEVNWTQANCNKETSQYLSGRSIGCYKDDWNRTLEFHYKPIPSLCTIELCSSICASKNYTYTGLENEKHCFCGENYTKHGRLDDLKCNENCAGDSSEICGGVWALSVYITCPVGYFGNGCMSRCNCENEERCFCANCICSSGCKPGWIGSRCNVRNCLENNGGCSINEACVTVDLKFSSITRCECALGYQNVRLWDACTDVDECSLDFCDPLTTTCTNTIGNFTCNCQPGFERKNSTSCRDVDECNVGTHTCDYLTTTCNNKIGSYICDCKQGYDRLNQTFCHDIDECKQGDVCENVTSICKNTVGGFKCSCLEGYEPHKKVACKIAEKKALNEGQIAGAVIGPILGLILIVVVVIFLLRYYRHTHSTLDAELAETVRGTSTDKSLRRGKIQSLYPVIQINNALNTLRSKLADPEKMKTEFKLVQTKTKDACVIGTSKDMKTKNRFINIIPYDRNRVVLSRIGDDDTSDYINASYVQGYSDSDKFIAAQGPRSETVKDFWRMILEKDIRLIVMITNLMENQKVKCEKYWPNAGQPAVYGDITVTLTSEDSWPDYTVRQIQATTKSQTIDLMQWHYMAWPDHLAPSDAKSFLEFHRKIRRHMMPDIYTLVHCSAGAGRTGTFIAIDYLLEQEKAECDVDMLSCLKRMREQRSAMIQNLDQYEFVHSALLLAFTVKVTAIPVEQFPATYKSWREKNSETSDKSAIEIQFETIEATKNDAAENAIHVSSKSFPQSKIKDMEAVYVQSWKEKNAYISMKLPDSPHDFWTFCREQKSVTIVFLDPNKSTGDQFLPTKTKPIDLKDSRLQCESETSDDYGSRCIVTECRNSEAIYVNTALQSTDIYENIGTNSERTQITVLHVMEPLAKNSENKDSLFSLYNAVHNTTSSKNSVPVMVVTRTDCSLSGFCLAAFNAFDMIKHEKEVDLYQIVLNIRKSKTGLFNSMAFYVQLHDLIERHIRMSTG